MEGDPVTLHTGLLKTMADDEIQWMFGYKSIAKMCVTDGKSTVNYILNGRFRDRLELDKQTGSLTITNSRPEHSGVYQLQNNCLRKSFILTVQRCPTCMIGDVDDILVVEGYKFNLFPNHTDMMVSDVIQWKFVPENTLLAEINKQTNSMAVYDDVLDGRFRNRLKLDNQTGSLTIMNMTTKHTGVFEVRTKNLRKRYIFTVYVRLPDTAISTDCPSPSSRPSPSSTTTTSSSSSSPPSPSTTKTTSSSSSSSSGSHPNSIINQTQHLNISQLCQPCSDSEHCCGSTEAVIRLVLSALVGVATVIILVYEIRSRRAEQSQVFIHTSES
ncbi:uncharacterized protein LOC113039293 [Carassius auratus]|uniref:Uncharacterized protein LOC113039293 n=1 Tax=Carassius auratus TaxID=7957 RepID=A0A6P6IYP9_CARAU|nr:uncharacterized protein LOC113039293 [Carassius auratus]XP_026052910.1 uncharacterized protein LOC113039293 [Carassius auratus]